MPDEIAPAQPIRIHQHQFPYAEPCERQRDGAADTAHAHHDDRPVEILHRPVRAEVQQRVERGRRENARNPWLPTQPLHTVAATVLLGVTLTAADRDSAWIAAHRQLSAAPRHPARLNRPPPGATQRNFPGEVPLPPERRQRTGRPHLIEAHGPATLQRLPPDAYRFGELPT